MKCNQYYDESHDKLTFKRVYPMIIAIAIIILGLVFFLN